MSISCMCRSYLTNNCCNDLLRHLRLQMHPSIPQILNFQQRNRKENFGQRWHTRATKLKKGRWPGFFGHKLYALVKLKEANENQYHVITKNLPH